jgi:Xaa-Pro aminopeptidase
MVVDHASNYDKIKTPTEIEDQIIGAHKTAESFIRMLAHVEHIVANGGQITEIEAVSFFKNKEAIDFSFVPICACGKNTAIVHHQASDGIVKNESLFLFDAGFHFENSTTDMTRVVYIGNKISSVFKKVYTIILKSVIHYSMARFPNGTKGSCLDSICRYCMWQNSMDYHFGTGHGVGNYRSVHQKPAISSGSNDRIMGNMITTVEPGYYTDDFGIRLENMLASIEEPDGYVTFETITYIPFCHKLIDFKMLDKKERDWLCNYNKRILNEYLPLFSGDRITTDWVIENTKNED